MESFAGYSFKGCQSEKALVCAAYCLLEKLAAVLGDTSGFWGPIVVNKLELLVYNAVKRNPRLKLYIRDVYQVLLDAVPTSRMVSAYPILAREGYFFGFHDHTPFSPDNSLLAACRYDLSLPLHMPTLGEELELGVFEGSDFADWRGIAKTRAWNWHQGCRLQWLGTCPVLVFNDHLDGRNIARMVEIDDSKEEVLPQSIGSVSPDGLWAVGYDFERVEHYMPGYGYRYATGNKELGVERPKGDGLYLINIQDGTSSLLFSICEIADLQPDTSMSGAYHFFSHTIFAPSSQRFVFLHRWIHDDVIRRWSRVVTSDLSGRDVRIYPTKDMASHLSWRSRNELLAYCRLEDGRDRYVLFDDRNPQAYQIVGEGSFNSDGHPSWSPDGKYCVTDTYPDRFRHQYLALLDMQTQKRLNLARLRTYRKFATTDPRRHWSCDLHPRWDRQGRYICFDATYSGKRSLCTLDFGRPVGELDRIPHM